MLEGFTQDLVKVPVDQIIFIKEIPVKRLSGRPAFLDDLFHCDLFYRHTLHALLHCRREPVFHFFLPAIRLFLITASTCVFCSEIFFNSVIYHIWILTSPLCRVNFMRRLWPDVFLISAIIDVITVVYSGNLEIYESMKSH